MQHSSASIATAPKQQPRADLGIHGNITSHLEVMIEPGSHGSRVFFSSLFSSCALAVVDTKSKAGDAILAPMIQMNCAVVVVVQAAR